MVSDVSIHGHLATLVYAKCILSVLLNGKAEHHGQESIVDLSFSVHGGQEIVSKRGKIQK